MYKQHISIERCQELEKIFWKVAAETGRRASIDDMIYDFFVWLREHNLEMDFDPEANDWVLSAQAPEKITHFLLTYE